MKVKRYYVSELSYIIVYAVTTFDEKFIVGLRDAINTEYDIYLVAI